MRNRQKLGGLYVLWPSLEYGCEVWNANYNVGGKL